MTKRFGFTLAEVLITLGIIGVVAAMTIPTLVKNYQKTVWVNQLKKSVSTLEQGFQKALADDGVDSLLDSEFVKRQGNESNQQYLERTFSKYFKVTKVEDLGEDIWNSYKALNGGELGLDSVYGIYLEDGTMLLVYMFGFDEDGILSIINTRTNTKSLGGKFNTSIFTDWGIGIDINGNKKPNVMGRDYFQFILAEDGHLYPEGGRDYAIWSWQKSITDTSNTRYWKNSNDCSNSGYGFQCPGRIVESGWKMDY